ncbi:WD40-repeat-containing domain protein [Hysterangium stoloniferum]|nr:WD40-repeat-containing domain protein [Hysterangium stoloniferum]
MSSRAKKNRPASTSAISLPKVIDSSAHTSLGYFSPDAELFALVVLAVDKHRLRIFDAATDTSVVEHTIDAARVTSLSWISLDLSEQQQQQQQQEPASNTPSKKRKKTAQQQIPAIPKSHTTLVSLGLSNGSLILFSPKHARVLRTLSHPSSLAAIQASSPGKHPGHIWTSGADGFVRLWNAARNELVGKWKLEGGPCTAIAHRPTQKQASNRDADHEELLVASHAVRLLSVPVSSTASLPTEKVSFTGHVSPVTSLQWGHGQASQFVSAAEADRVVNVWLVPDGSLPQGTILANVPLDAFARHIALSFSSSTLLTVSASGRVALFDLPSAPSKPTKVSTLSPRSTISAPSKKGDGDVMVIAAAFMQQPGHICVARLKGGAKPVFEVVRYLDEKGEYIPQISLTKDVSTLATMDSTPIGAQQKRYTEAPTLAVGSGHEIGQDGDEALMNVVDGDLDIDLAEMSLGQRLTATTGGTIPLDESASDSDTRPKQNLRKSRNADDGLPLAPTQTLSRTLIQALHSSDTQLLETCLLHTDERVVFNTVRRIPPQLAVPLLEACVERLSRGARGTSGKGGGGGASAQRGTGLVRWVRAVLIVHTAHLMTIPDLVTRLSSLHATISARLALRDPLLALNGRLDLVLSQVELRASGPAPIVSVSKGKEKKEPYRYVEGEEDEDEMEVEEGDDAGSVEDVELGGTSESEEGEESDDEEGEDNDSEDESEEDYSEDGGLMNGFVDDEAEEDWTEESDEGDE